MRFEIIEKLKSYLLTHSINVDDQVVYLMVELRKLLDRQGDRGETSKYPLIRFYSDWAVHTDKDHITSAMKKVLQQIESTLTPYPKDDDVSFLLLPEFRKEMRDLFLASSFDMSLCEDKNKWKQFVLSLTQVLADQPMLNPSRNIKEFRYTTRDNDHLSLNIDFNNGTGINIIIAEDML